MQLLPSRLAEPGFAALTRRMDRLFQETFGEGVAGEFVGPALDLSETEDALHVQAEIPGVDPEHVDISITGDQLTIRGEKQAQTEEEGRSWHRIERRRGSFSRTLSLPAAVDAEKVEATVRDGVLSVTLPKREDARPRRIDVRTS